jgi:FixJ family two-component response regulator
VTIPWVIHVVDDDEPVRAAFTFALQVVGFNTVAYAGPDDFLARGRETHGILISDVRMAGMNGIELTRLLRRGGSNMPIILVTGHADDELQTDAKSAGANLLLGKPVEFGALVAEISRLTTDWE